MQVWKFDGLLQESGWVEPAFVRTNAQGNLAEITDKVPEGVESYHEVRGFALPGLVNSHSHAFQYGMAGQAEYLRDTSDDFWAWRDAMYALAAKVSPEDLQAIAAMLYSEMLRQGYTRVVEFHYLHHGSDGKAYANLAEMGERLMLAAREVGMSLTLVPVHYQRGGFGAAALPRQARFISRDLDAYLKILEASRSLARGFDRVQVAGGIHSLRAVPPDQVTGLFRSLPSEEPKHLHISEQRREVEEALEHLGRRPVAWLLDQVPLDQNYHLVHATHLDAEECRKLAKSGAHVVICPSTEGNLGDGFFPLSNFRAAGGNWSIGSDSHVCLDPFEELRWLDYGQRLQSEKRNILGQAPGEDSAHLAFDAALRGGRAAAGETSDAYFRIGQPFDALVISSQFPTLAIAPPERRLGTILYASDARAKLGTISAGNWVVKHHKHLAQEPLLQRFQDCIRRLHAR